MKVLLSGLLLVAVALASVGTAWADTLSISGDVPITYTFNESQLHDAKANGALIGVSLPFFLGFGAESYKVKGKAGPGTPIDPDFEYKVAMFDVFFDIPFPAANLRLGAGVGKGDFSIPSQTTLSFDSARLAQAYFNLGIPFGGIFDVHLGYHVIGGSTNDNSVPSKSLNLGSKMATVGIKIGF
jgi:hypothetical protein